MRRAIHRTERVCNPKRSLCREGAVVMTTPAAVAALRVHREVPAQRSAWRFESPNPQRRRLLDRLQGTFRLIVPEPEFEPGRPCGHGILSAGNGGGSSTFC